MHERRRRPSDRRGTAPHRSLSPRLPSDHAQQHRVQHDQQRRVARSALPCRDVVRPTMAHELMPVNAARYGVRPLTRMPISSTSGISVGQRWRSDCAQVGHLLVGEAAQAVALGLEVHLHEHAEEVHERRHDRRDDDRLVRHVQELDHQERRGAHDRRRDLAAGGRRRFHAAREVARIADADHRRDRERADGHRVGHRRSGQHAEHRRAEHAHLGRARRRSGRRSTRRCRGTAARGRCAWPARRTARSGRRRSRRRRPRCRRCPGSSGTGG